MDGSQISESLNNTCAILILILFPVNVGYSAFISKPALENRLDKVEGRC
jgi:hypothetical protein